MGRYMPNGQARTTLPLRIPTCRIRQPRRLFCLLFLGLAFPLTGVLSARDADVLQLTLDVEDPCFEVLAGDWYLPGTKTGSYLAYYYLEIDGPGTGAGRARWVAEGLPEGTYAVEYYADHGDYPADARFRVVHAGGVANVGIDLNYMGAGWRALGAFPVDRVCVVEITDGWAGAGSRMRADAIRLTLQTSMPPPSSSPIPPHIGICIDDAGSVDPTSPSTPLYQMLRLPFAMTFAVLPARSYSAASAEEIHRRGSEVFLHQPMGYITSPNPSGSEWIRSSMTPAQARAVLAANLDSIPHEIGVNNHTGSLVTQQADKMQACMDELKQRGLFWYDSRTFTMSVAYDVAKAKGLLTGERDLFIDGNNKEEAKELIRRLARRALYAPHLPHLAIGHVRDGTADALGEMVPELEAMGVEVWPISRCMTQVVETDAQPEGGSFGTIGPWSAGPDDRVSKELVDGEEWFVAASPPGGPLSASFGPALPIEGQFDVYATWTHDTANADVAWAVVNHRYGLSRIDVDMSSRFADWLYLGQFEFGTGASGSISFETEPSDVPEWRFPADAVKLVYSGPHVPRADLLSLW